MKTFKLLPITLAVMASSNLAMAAESTVTELEKRIQDLETRLDVAKMEEARSDIDLIFSGYARYGAHYKSGDEKTVGSYGALNSNATGRLGNEGNGGEYQLATSRTSASGAKWDLVFMLEEWGNGVGVKKMHAGVSNLFESQPEVYLWGGRTMHQRPQTDLNDYFWMMHDGQGFGMHNYNVGGVKVDLGVVENNGGGAYALTSKLHGIEFGGASLNLYANYGFASDEISEDFDTNENTTAYQVGAELLFAGQKLVARYADNSINSAFDLNEGQDAFLLSFDGGLPITKKAGIQYLAAYQTLDAKADKDGKELSRDNYNVIVRPTYAWNDTHSTWLEMGYNVVDYKDIDATNESWKFTVSQNISIDAFAGARPMLRFYGTIGGVDNEFQGYKTTTTYNPATGQNDVTVHDTVLSGDPDTVTFGVMFESWW